MAILATYMRMRARLRALSIKASWDTRYCTPAAVTARNGIGTALGAPDFQLSGFVHVALQGFSCFNGNCSGMCLTGGTCLCHCYPYPKLLNSSRLLNPIATFITSIVTITITIISAWHRLSTATTCGHSQGPRAAAFEHCHLWIIVGTFEKPFIGRQQERAKQYPFTLDPFQETAVACLVSHFTPGY